MGARSDPGSDHPNWKTRGQKILQSRKRDSKYLRAKSAHQAPEERIAPTHKPELMNAQGFVSDSSDLTISPFTKSKNQASH